MMNTILAGLTVGAIYTIVAVGYNIVFVATGVFNFAQAQFVMLGSFVAFFVMVTIGLSWPVAVLACIAVGFLLGLAEEVLAVRPLRGKGAHGELVTTLGVAVLLDGVAVLIWGTNPHFVSFGTAKPVSLLGGRIYPAEIALILIGVGLALIADAYARRTLLGKMSLAAAEDHDAARLRGIDVSRLSLFSFGLAGAVCMVGGLLVAAKTGASAGLGAAFAVKGFVALAIGGFGSQKGALVGGMAAGLVEAFAARYAGASYQNLSVFVLLVALLMVRPSGLFGEKGQRVV